MLHFSNKTKTKFSKVIFFSKKWHKLCNCQHTRHNFKMSHNFIFRNDIVWSWEMLYDVFQQILNPDWHSKTPHVCKLTCFNLLIVKFFSLILDHHHIWPCHDPTSVQNFDFCESDYPPFFILHIRPPGHPGLGFDLPGFWPTWVLTYLGFLSNILQISKIFLSDTQGYNTKHIKR